jgi:hypothetical protein
MRNNCIYFVEGRCEEKLLNALKEQPQKILSGRVKVFNVIQNALSNSQLITIQPGTTVALVFDTDVPQTDCLKNRCILLLWLLHSWGIISFHLVVTQDTTVWHRYLFLYCAVSKEMLYLFSKHRLVRC